MSVGNSSDVPVPPVASKHIVLIQDAFKRHDDRASDLQRQRLSFAMRAVAVGPAAVILLTTQVLAFKGHRAIGISLVAIECALLLYALEIGFLGLGRAHKQWVKARVRAEVVRREEFLFRATVGPYLLCPSGSLADWIRERLVRIDSEVNSPLELIEMKQGSKSWKDTLEDSRSSTSLTSLPELLENMRVYLEQRVSAQRKWYSSKSESHQKVSERFDSAAKLSLTGALMLAIFHLAVLIFEEHIPRGASQLWVDVILPLVAISLPAIGAMITGLASIYGSERLARSYRYYAETLEGFETDLRRLHSQIRENLCSPREAQFRFSRIVLAVEELLSNELRLWWLVMYPNVPKASG